MPRVSNPGRQTVLVGVSYVACYFCAWSPRHSLQRKRPVGKSQVGNNRSSVAVDAQKAIHASWLVFTVRYDRSPDYNNNVNDTGFNVNEVVYAVET